MIVYRIVQLIERAGDLSGTGAFRDGGRWNNAGTYMLYTSENSSLAFLESLAHFDANNIPADLYIIRLEINADEKIILILQDKAYPENWMDTENFESKMLGDKLMEDKKYLAIKVKSKVNPYEYNYLLNPLFPRYYDLIKIISVEKLKIDTRLI